MSMITRSSQKKQSLSTVPPGTAYIMHEGSFRLLAGNSRNIRNVSLKGDGTRETAKFFLQLCNSLRKGAEYKEVECIFFNPEKEKRFDEQKGEKFAFIQSQSDVPKAILDHSEGGYLVSPKLYETLEAKVTMARACQLLSNPEERIKIIQEFLAKKRMNRIVIKEKLDAAVQRSIIPTGVVEKVETYEDATQQIKKLLEEHKDTGIVFQRNKGTGGLGTALLSAEKIKDILKGSDVDILKNIFNMFGYKIDSKADVGQIFFEDIQEKALSWQKMVSGTEVCFMFRTNSETRQLEMPAVANMFIDPKEGPLGNIIVPTEQLDTIADFKLNKEQEKYFILSNELMLHIMLELKGYKKGINEIYDADGSNLKIFSNDIFLSIAKDGSIKHQISEFNIRTTPSAQAVVSAETIGAPPPFMRLFTPNIAMSKDVFERLKNLGVDKTSDFFSKKFNPILEKFEGAFIDSFTWFDTSKANDPKKHFTYSWNIFYPKPDMKNKGQKEFEAMQEIYKICKNITIDDIHETLGLRRSSRLREASSRSSKRLKTR